MNEYESAIEGEEQFEQWRMRQKARRDQEIASLDREFRLLNERVARDDARRAKDVLIFKGWSFAMTACYVSWIVMVIWMVAS